MDGNSRILWWLLGIFVILFFGAAGMWVKAVDSKSEYNLAINVAQGERIRALEVYIEQQRSWQDKMDGKMDSIIKGLRNDRK